MANVPVDQPARDAHFLRRSFDVARRATAHGNHPFGAILVDRDGNLLLEAENGYMPSHDGTAHSERLLATQACTELDPGTLRSATLYSSAEPCAMCAGAIYWAGIGSLVYGLSEHRLRDLTGNHPENPTLNLPCRESMQAADAGRVANPMQCRGQVEGGVAQSLGAALYEEMVIDDDGRVINPKFRDYHLPSFADVPRTEVFFADTSDTLGPTGAKSMSESPYNPVVAALGNAIANATGIRFTATRFKPDRLWPLLHEKFGN
jgi:tRNA(Arg) A34 adenosine deaminase TadA